MGADPVPVPADVGRAVGMVINHLGETTDMVVRHVKALSGYAFQAAEKHIFGTGGPASEGREMALGILLWPGRSVLVSKCGFLPSFCRDGDRRSGRCRYIIRW